MKERTIIIYRNASLLMMSLCRLYVRVSSLKNRKKSTRTDQYDIRSVTVGVFVKDGDNHFNYLYWNHFMEEITGIETREIEGHDDFEVNYNALMTARGASGNRYERDQDRTDR